MGNCKHSLSCYLKLVSMQHIFSLCRYKPLWLCQLESLAVGSGHTPHLHCCVVRLISRISWRFEKLVFSPDFFSSDQVFPNPYCSRTLVCRTKLIGREHLRLAQQCKLIYDLISCFYSRHSKHFCRILTIIVRNENVIIFYCNMPHPLLLGTRSPGVPSFQTFFFLLAEVPFPSLSPSCALKALARSLKGFGCSSIFHGRDRRLDVLGSFPRKCTWKTGNSIRFIGSIIVCSKSGGLTFM